MFCRKTGCSHPTLPEPLDPEADSPNQSWVTWETPEYIHGRFDPLDLTEIDGQMSVVHEFGHIIGGRHPGPKDSEIEYSADNSSLMGNGMELRPLYFAAWAEMMKTYTNEDWNMGHPMFPQP